MNNYEITCIDYLNVILNNVTVSLIQLLPKIWSLSYANELCYISTHLLKVSKINLHIHPWNCTLWSYTL